MSTGGLVAIIIVVVIVVAAIVVAAMAAARRRRLQQRFGPEYDRVVGERGSQLKAESELAGRERRIRSLDIRPLSDAARACCAPVSSAMAHASLVGATPYFLASERTPRMRRTAVSP